MRAKQRRGPVRYPKTMASTAIVSVREYLSASYRPDREYIDGIILERNLGERDHSEVQTNLSSWLHSRHKELGIWVYVEQRVQVKPSRFRVPDICVVAGPKPLEQVFTQPPLICIEILSKDDRAGEMQERIDDYLAFGVRYVWVVNPTTRRAYVHTTAGTREAKDGVLRTENPEIVAPLAEIFSSL